MEESFSPLENWLVHLFAGTTPTGVDLTSPTCRFQRIPVDDPKSHPLTLEPGADYSLFYAGNKPKIRKSSVILMHSSVVEVKYVSYGALTRLDIALCISEAEVSIARRLAKHFEYGAQAPSGLTTAFTYLQLMGFSSWQCLYLLSIGKPLTVYLRKVRYIMNNQAVDITKEEQPVIDRILSYNITPPELYPWQQLSKALQ